MGRPKQHDDGTAAALLAAAEHSVQPHRLAARPSRRVAAAVGTTTRAVYSLFGSKDGLVVALGAHSFDVLRTALEALPTTDDPTADLVEAGLTFRSFALEHPSLFAIGVQRRLPTPELWAQFSAAASRALVELERRLARLSDADLLGGRSVDAAALQFHALCEGLAPLEFPRPCPPMLPQRMWRDTPSP